MRRDLPGVDQDLEWKPSHTPSPLPLLSSFPPSSERGQGTAAGLSPSGAASDKKRRGRLGGADAVQTLFEWAMR